MNKNALYPSKTITFLTLVILSLGVLAVNDYRNTVITDPAISRRCDALMKQRNEKVEHKQKIMDLIQRNKRLISITPPERITVIEKLRKNFKSLGKELRHTLNQIQNREESIIRKGCPGITI